MLRIMTLLAVAALVLVGSAIAEPIQWTVEEGGNGHWYELVPVNQETTGNWCYCQYLAGERYHMGSRGHLVTITNQAEQNWIFTTYGSELLNWIAMGLHQLSNAIEPSGGWGWITGEPMVFAYWSMAFGEPNNWGGYEDFGMFSTIEPGYWNDIYNMPANGQSSHLGYLIEYDGYSVNPLIECQGVISSEQSSWGEIKKAYR